jgi:S1-C subfamily serine protease
MVKYVFLAISFLFVNIAISNDAAQHLQDISVTIDSGRGQGSGVIVTREMKLKKDEDKTAKVNFVWTAAHVVESLRQVRTVVDPATGTEKKVVEFGPVKVIKELTENGRKVGETRMEGKVVKYSDKETGHDVALLMLYKRNFVDVNAKFYLDEEITAIGTPLFHVGSLLGQGGSNSMTTGIISQIGRVVTFGGVHEVIFDQTTVTAFPGSSGGGVFRASDNKYVGMLVRGAGETFNLIVPVRRLAEFAKKNKLTWALDDAAELPSLEEVLAQSIEDTKVLSNSEKRADAAASPVPPHVGFPSILSPRVSFYDFH